MCTHMAMHPTNPVPVLLTLRRKNGIGGDLQLTAHEYVAPLRIAVFWTTGSARIQGLLAGGQITPNVDHVLASWLTFLRKPGKSSLRSVLRDACGNGSLAVFATGDLTRRTSTHSSNSGACMVCGVVEDIVRHTAPTILHLKKASRVVVVCGRH